MRSPGTAVIAEDDADISDLIQMVLTQSGFTVVVAPDGFQAIEAVREHQPVLTTLDVNMPGIDGFAVAKQLRRFSETYLIMITSLTEEVDIIRGFEAGADDYLVKPFSPRELRARADAMVRRLAFAPAAPLPAAVPEAESWVAAAAREFRGSVGEKPPRAHPIQAAVPPPAAPAPPPVAPAAPPVAQPPVAQPVAPAPVAPAPVAPAPVVPVAQDQGSEQTEGALRFGELRVDAVAGTASLRGSALELTRAESDVLISLLRTGRRVRSKADLVLTMRGQDYVTSYFVNEADKRAVESHVASLRRKLDDDGATPRYIETVRGVGYRMAERG